MRIFFDTNVLIAAFVSRGTCKELFEYCLTSHTIYTSQLVIDEFTDTLSMKLKFPSNIVNKAVNFIQENLTKADFGPLLSQVCRDPKDDKILASAVSGNVECIITGDEDLLILREFRGISILKPREFWRFEKEKQL